MVVISAGVSQKPGENRISLLARNSEVMRSVVTEVMKNGFDGIFLVATNPVDLMTLVTACKSNLPPSRIIGTGTVLDSARLRFSIGQRLGIDPHNVHAYVLGEHGDSEFVPWSQATIGTKSITSYIKESGRNISTDMLAELEDEVKNSAYKIIEAKGLTCYGIGMAMSRITQAILSDENSLLTVSAPAWGEYGISNVWIGLPCIVGQGGIREVIELNLADHEIKKLRDSAALIKGLADQIKC